MIVNCVTYQGGRRVWAPADLSDALDQARSCGDPSAFLWLGLFEPEPDELDLVASEFGLHPLAVEDAMSAHQRPKLEHYKDSTFLVFKTLLESDPHNPLRLGEISVFLGENFIVTVRHGDANPLSGVRTRIEGEQELLAHGPSAVLYVVADQIVDSYTHYATLMQDSIDELETEVFSAGRGDYGGPIYALKRNAIVFGRAVAPLVYPTKALVGGEEPGIAKETLPYFRDVADHVLRSTEAAREWNELLDHMLDADRSRVSVQQNNDMRRISAWAAILAVPTAIAGIYGMNFDNMPELHYHYAYFIVLGIMAVACGVLYVLLKRAKWL
ncbi:MAG: magnesium and cobalt transport protein CorA [Catenulisporales bacterium]|nr:magnesium and cobalt transport protein CorA [Catenulisporales bacterium]